MRSLLFSFFIILIQFSGSAQDLDTLTNLQAEKDTAKVHSPKKAVLFSACIPGAGQVYNHIAMPKGKKKAYWKLPLIYGGLGATGYFLYKNHTTIQSLRKEYTFRQDTGTKDDLNWLQYDDGDLLEIHDQYQTWRDLSIIGFGLVYIIQIVDAGVEAHFVNFDISEDLSLSIQPKLYNLNTAGVGCTFNFR